MTVASSWEDTVWQAHLGGYLTVLWQSGRQVAGEVGPSILARALRFFDKQSGAWDVLDDASVNNTDEVALLVEISKLRLKTLAQELHGLSNGLRRPRKLDVQKLRFSVKQIYADLKLLSMATFPLEAGTLCMTSIEYSAVRIVAAGLLVQCGQFLHPAASFHTTRECASLNSTISIAVDEISAKVAAMFPIAGLAHKASANHSVFGRLQTTTVRNALSVVWPLFAMGTAANISGTHRAWAQNTLLRIGDNARTPIAFHLVCPPRYIS